jgi:Zn-finger nucleic acid-binding protein
MDRLTVDWCKSCRGLFLDPGELQRVKQWREKERRKQRHATAKDVVMWLSDVAEDASESLSESPDARWQREHPDEVHERDRDAMFEILGEKRPSRDPAEDRAPTGTRPWTLFPVHAGAFFLGWFLARVSLPWLGVPESPLLSWWSILTIGVVSIVAGLWLESPRRTPFPRISLYVVQALGLVLVLEPIFGVKKMPTVRGLIVAVVIGSILLVLATVLLRYAPRRRPPGDPFSP